MKMNHESVKIWVGSLIKYCKPNWDVIASISKPSKVVLSCLYQFDDLTLKLSRTTNEYKLLLAILSKLNSKYPQNPPKCQTID